MKSYDKADNWEFYWVRILRWQMGPDSRVDGLRCVDAYNNVFVPI